MNKNYKVSKNGFIYSVEDFGFCFGEVVRPVVFVRRKPNTCGIGFSFESMSTEKAFDEILKMSKDKLSFLVDNNETSGMVPGEEYEFFWNYPWGGEFHKATPTIYNENILMSSSIVK